jgi:hypothetical protein
MAVASRLFSRHAFVFLRDFDVALDGRTGRYSPSYLHKPEELIPERTLSVISLNMAKETNPDKMMRALDSAPRLSHADLFLLQEVADADGKTNAARDVARRLGYFSAFGAAPRRSRSGTCSRQPLSDQTCANQALEEMRPGFRSQSRFALTAAVQTPWGDLRLWNAHLDTRMNAAERLEQFQPVIEEAARHTGPQ